MDTITLLCEMATGVFWAENSMANDLRVVAKLDTQTVTYQRGEYDARHGRPPLFRSTVAFGIIPNSDDPQADGWTQSQRASYLRGYNSVEVA